MREGPERVPTPQVLPAAIVIGKIVLFLLIGAALASNPTLLAVITSVVVWTTAMGACVFYALFLGNKLNRFSATFTAILGIDLILSTIFGIALVVQQTFAFDVSQSVAMIFQLWHVAIIGFIMHRALNINLGFGIGVGLLIALFCVTLSEVATL